jgi:hypothetical protein
MNLLVERKDGQLVDYRMAAAYAVILMWLDLVLLDLQYGFMLSLSIIGLTLFTLATGAALFNHPRTIDKPYSSVLVVAINLALVAIINTLILK